MTTHDLTNSVLLCGIAADDCYLPCRDSTHIDEVQHILEEEGDLGVVDQGLLGYYLEVGARGVYPS